MNASITNTFFWLTTWYKALVAMCLCSNEIWLVPAPYIVSGKPGTRDKYAGNVVCIWQEQVLLPVTGSVWTGCPLGQHFWPEAWLVVINGGVKAFIVCKILNFQWVLDLTILKTLYIVWIRDHYMKNRGWFFLWCSILNIFRKIFINTLWVFYEFWQRVDFHFLK